MYISSAITMIVLGAILAFAVEFDIAGIDINVIGIILMIGGLIGAILSLTMFRRPTGDREVVRERRAR